MKSLGLTKATSFLKFFLIFFIIFSGGTLSVFGAPILSSYELKVEEIASGLQLPTTFEFVKDGILVLQKNDGKIFLIRDGKISKEPVLDVEVSYIGERGLLGITELNSFIYLYYTESEKDGGEPLGNRIYRYDWDGQNLINPILIKDLPAIPGPLHNSGVLVNDGKAIYAVIGDLLREGSLAQNTGSGKFDDTSVIFKIEGDDLLGIQSREQSTEYQYFAIGIRNSFGLAIDPITGKLWETENGDYEFDEINLVNEKFNSGWKKLMGPSTESQRLNFEGLESFVYSDPEFNWERPVAPTALTFINSEFFDKFNDSLLVASFNLGTIYEFKLNEERTGFVFDEPALLDLVANRGESLDDYIFGIGFGGITDMKIGPDGLLYVLALIDGTIYKISPLQESQSVEKFLTPSCSEPPQPKVNWFGCNFSKANLENVDLRFANLSNTNFEGANLQNADLSYANLQKAKLTNSNIQNAKLQSAKLQNSDFSNSDLKNAKLTGSNLLNANLENVDLLKGDLSYTDLVNTNFYNANLNQTNFVRAYIEKADFSDANFYKTNIPSCFGSNFTFKVLRFGLTEIIKLNFFLFEPIEWIIPKLCGPHYYIEPVPFG